MNASTGFVFRQIQPHEVGYDYAQAVRDLHQHFTYERIAEAIGYESKTSVLNVLQGGTPDHARGEALYVLYAEMFGTKPPLKVQLTEQHRST